VKRKLPEIFARYVQNTDAAPALALAAAIPATRPA
jgi:hypothetical protein